MCLKLLCRPAPHLQVFTEVDFLTIFRDYPIFGAQLWWDRGRLRRWCCIANEAPSLLWVWEQTVGFVTAKWLYLRWHCPLRSGTILTPNSSLGVKAAPTYWWWMLSYKSSPLKIQWIFGQHFIYKPIWCLPIKCLEWTSIIGGGSNTSNIHSNSIIYS